MKTTTSINYSKDTFLKTYELDRTKVYQVEKIPDFHVLRKHSNTLLRELSFNSPYIIKYYNIKYNINEQRVYTVLEKTKRDITGSAHELWLPIIWGRKTNNI